MTYIITDKCEGCGDCMEECPVDAISEQGGTYTIDVDSCVDCDTCAEVCPVDAAVPEDEA